MQTAPTSTIARAAVAIAGTWRRRGYADRGGKGAVVLACQHGPADARADHEAWSPIEQATRKYVLRAPGDVYVFTGPFFSRKRETIGPGQVWVPSHTWKPVYTPTDKRAWAYWMTNDGVKPSLRPISCADLVKYSGLRLLPDGAASTKAPSDLSKD